ncbi:sorbosone dehydrogenase family protein [Bradyrhizobium sp. AUGA SZCCT0169]|uniref:PQQ-dependent sugar dehydrogenase n=1 Tax=unclassified Bradyrhizobium TaxID=2631580 RepID=UPI001BAD44C3|nr:MULTISPECIES: sorbosone dehydrogenase family protein [unclassified Bradyrhizobium]MBR1193550.1 sorbosone dehydrogenase family protein [Bradyrhizobium sp. AUGA SZCCT0160]MBR1250890.1 sorbosone dehydrogenase family protein [Bradyrhizobium sp. AUGA SZCCT0169]
MHSHLRLALCLGALALPLAACNEQAPSGSAEQTYGPSPQLPAPQTSWIPTVNIATAKGWPEGSKPTAGNGMAVNAFASGLEHPRTVYVLPNGDVLVAESNAPPKPDGGGIKGFFFKWAQSRAGAGVPSANRITLLRDSDGDGVAETRSIFLSGLNSPFGMVLVGEEFYVANTDAIMKFPYQTGVTRITAAGEKLTDLPAGTLNHHWTKDLAASRDGSKLYATVGSNSNIGENGIEAEKDRAAVLEVDRASGTWRVFASGLRNPNAPAWNPHTGELWVVVNERDELGNDLVPDYMTSVKDGAFYGWPYSYFGDRVDTRVEPRRPDMVAKAMAPDYALGAHTASLGLEFNTGNLFPQAMAGGAFIGQHGSWNRKPRAGYRVIFVSFEGGKPSGKPQDVLTGFVSDDGEARGRPVGVRLDKQGALLVADDVGNTVWRVTPAMTSAAR